MDGSHELTQIRVLVAGLVTQRPRGHAVFIVWPDTRRELFLPIARIGRSPQSPLMQPNEKTGILHHFDTTSDKDRWPLPRNLRCIRNHN